MRRICLAITGLMLLVAPVAASDGKQAAATALEAAQALQKHARQVAAAGKRLDPTVAPASEHLRRIFDAKAFAALPPVAASDVAWIIDWLDAARTANHTLIDFGADPKGPAQLEPAALARNLLEFEDQLAVAITFQQRLFPRALETLHDFLESLPEAQRTPVRLQGLAKMVDGYLESVKGALCFAADSNTKPANARMIVAAAHEAAEIWIELTEEDTRKQFIALVAAAQQLTKDKEIAQHFRAIQAALEAVKS
jgi:hypothetical protein